MSDKRGARNAEVAGVIASLKRHGRANKQKLWLDAASALKVPRRKRVEVTLDKLTRLSKRLKDGNRILLVPGKVVAGTAETKPEIQVAALSFSRGARAQLAGKGKAIELTSLVEGKQKPSEVLLIK